ncbi:MAG: adenylyl-sulfate kinase [Leptolyngbya foveolarum]|uniref:gluconokinase n=1 Tax=Leptolyngbya foveolarum TaxID=47253 RepID=A0A2W4WGC1_9CYAN|nr:MAG: adenylyl-sulfate kinase [Leptolyngbya foveolarum]
MPDSSLPTLVQQMLLPEFYSHPVTEPVRLMQTHVSYVLLTGDYVYKLKKPVNFGFLDYSTLEKREHFCQEELRLNQRGAGSLYLSVVQINESAGVYEIDGEGDAADYAVKMRQFPQSALLSSQFEQGEFDEVKVRSLAKTIAEFHSKTRTSDHIRSYGTVEKIREAFDENYAQTEGFVGGDAVSKPQTQKQFDETKAYTDNFFATRQELLQQRLDKDRIRACHGDLHLGNICEWNDKILLFDCIEFNEPFRFVDVMYDIAYVVMDLEIAGRKDLSNAFINQYAEETGDWEGLKVLPMYVSRQSYVRAKVTSFMLGDPSVSDEDKKAASEKAAKYYRLSWSYLQDYQPGEKGSIAAMAGLSGSGKSTTARLLAEQSGAIHLRSDAVRKHLAGIPLDQKGGDDLYTAEMSDKTYSRLIDLGVQLANEGYSVVLDAKFDRKAKREEAIAAAKAQNLPLAFVHCQAPEDVLKTRLDQRSGDIADATADILARQSMEPFAETDTVKVVDTTQSRAEIQKQLGDIF